MFYHLDVRNITDRSGFSTLYLTLLITRYQRIDRQYSALNNYIIIDEYRVIMTIEIGDVAPDFTVMSTDRESFNLYTELEKGPILLNFYIGDFGINCMNYMIKFIESANKIIDLGVTMVPINSDSLDSHKLWKKRIDAPFEFLFDEDKKVSKQYGAIVGPGYMVSGFTNREFFLIGRDKKVKFIWKATTPKSIPTFDEILEGIKKAI